MEGHRRVCCHLFNSRKELRHASFPLHTRGPSTEGPSSPRSPQSARAASVPVGLGHPQPQSGSPSRRSGTGLWRTQRLPLDEMQFSSSGPFPAGILLMETASETIPFAAPNPCSSAKQTVRCVSPQTVPPRVAAPPQHPPVPVQVKAGGK